MEDQKQKAVAPSNKVAEEEEPPPPASSAGGGGSSTSRADEGTVPAPLGSRHSVDESLLEPFRYISSVPGKDVRGTLIDCFDAWFRVDPSRIGAVKSVVASLHNASLLIDDIEDNSKLRRGIPAAHTVFGVPAVINCANYVYFLALEECHGMNNARASRVFVEELLNLHRGQGRDIASRESLQCPTEDEYLQMVRDKTGGLFRLAVGLMQSHATRHAGTDFGPLVDDLAVYFQVRDDYINLADVEYFKSKSFCEDLTEGKFSFPMIHCIRSNPGDHRLVSILRQRTEDAEIKRYAQRILKESGSLSYTRGRCRELRASVVGRVGAFGGNPRLLQLLEALDVQLERMEEDAGGQAEAGEGRSRSTTASERGELRIDEA
jgi:geranylgeranyl diphosphate synthase type 3